MYRLIYQKPAHFLSVQMALVSTFFQMFIVLGMYNFGLGVKSNFVLWPLQSIPRTSFCRYIIAQWGKNLSRATTISWDIFPNFKSIQSQIFKKIFWRYIQWDKILSRATEISRFFFQISIYSKHSFLPELLKNLAKILVQNNSIAIA